MTGIGNDRIFGIFLGFYLALFSSCLFANKVMTYSDLPQSIQSKIKDGINSVFQNRVDQIKFEILAGGLSGTPLFKVTHGDKVYVARVLDNNLMASRKTILFSRFAGENGYGPKVYFPVGNDFKAQVMITGLALGNLPKLDEFDQYKAKLAKAVQMMHNTPYDSLPASDEMLKRISYHFAKAKTIGPFLEDIIWLEKIDNTIKLSTQNYGFTHQDLTVGNILYDGENFSFIDWPNGGFGDKMADVANLTFEFALDDSKALEFLQLYLEKPPSKKQIAHFMLLRKMAAFRLAAFSFEKIYKMGGTYKSVETKQSIEELIKLNRKGEWDPKTVDDFQMILQACYENWKKEQGNFPKWIQDLKQK